VIFRQIDASPILREGERRKTAQRTLFLLFENNNYFPMSDEKLEALFEFYRFFGTKGGEGGTLAGAVL
jgi:hypothetical protein